MRMNETLHMEADQQTWRWIHRILAQSKRDHNWLIRYANTIHSWLKRELESPSSPINNEDTTVSTSSPPSSPPDDLYPPAEINGSATH